MLTRDSNPVAASNSRASLKVCSRWESSTWSRCCLAARVASGVLAAFTSRRAASMSAASERSRAPSATATTEKLLPRAVRALIVSAMLSTEYGISGNRMMSAPPAMPAPSASHPALWPMISVRMIRWWLWAVE